MSYVYNVCSYLKLHSFCSVFKEESELQSELEIFHLVEICQTEFWSSQLRFFELHF